MSDKPHGNQGPENAYELDGAQKSLLRVIKESALELRKFMMDYHEDLLENLITYYEEGSFKINEFLIIIELIGGFSKEVMKDFDPSRYDINDGHNLIVRMMFNQLGVISGRWWTKTEIQDLVTCFEAGVSYNDIAKTLGRSALAVTVKANKLGLKKKRSLNISATAFPWSGDAIALLDDLLNKFQEGEIPSFTALAQKFQESFPDANYGIIHYQFHKRGLTFRKPGVDDSLIRQVNEMLKQGKRAREIIETLGIPESRWDYIKALTTDRSIKKADWSDTNLLARLIEHTGGVLDKEYVIRESEVVRIARLLNEEFGLNLTPSAVRITLGSIRNAGGAEEFLNKRKSSSRRWTDEDQLMLESLLEAGKYTRQDIAKIMGRHEDFIYKIIRRLNSTREG